MDRTFAAMVVITLVSVAVGELQRRRANLWRGYAKREAFYQEKYESLSRALRFFNHSVYLTTDGSATGDLVWRVECPPCETCARADASVEDLSRAAARFQRAWDATPEDVKETLGRMIAGELAK